MPLVPADVALATSVNGHGHFAAAVTDLVVRHQPRRVLETGTFDGTGSTRIVDAALRASSPGASFVSIEADPVLAAAAADRLPHVRVEQGLSLPRGMLPGRRAVAYDLAALHRRPEPIAVDYGGNAAMYVGECDKPGPDDVIGRVLGNEWSGRADLIILDSAGHLGWREFSYVTALLVAPCLIVLDDVRHVKHARSLSRARREDRFEVLLESEERYGFAVVRFTPA